MDRKRQDGPEQPQTKICAYCREARPLGEFQRRTGRRAGPNSRRGACRECRFGLFHRREFEPALRAAAFQKFGERAVAGQQQHFHEPTSAGSAEEKAMTSLCSCRLQILSMANHSSSFKMRLT